MLGGRRPRGAAKGKLCDVAVGLQNSQCFKSPFQRHPMEIITDVNTNWASEILSAVSLVAGKECCRLSSLVQPCWDLLDGTWKCWGKWWNTI